MENSIGDIPRPVWAEVDLAAMAHNLGQVRKKTKAMIMAIVKANAYGHGAYPVAKTLLASGADRLGVAILSEAVDLRLKGITEPVMILGYTPEQSAEVVVKHDIIQTVFSVRQAQALAQAAENLGKTATVHLKIDTGMHRIGFAWDRPEEIIKLKGLAGLHIEGAFTHFAVADTLDKSFTLSQLERFLTCVHTLESMGMPIAIKHTANSAAIIDIPEAHLDMVRPGIMLYGLAPSTEVDLKSVELRPAMTLKAQIAMIKELEAGDTVSYGRTYTAHRTVKVATLPLGYADGYSRILSNKAHALLNGKRVPVIGRICMDQCMLDISEVEGATEGEEVVLFGRGGESLLPVDELAEILGTINYEVVCMVGDRVPRMYITQT